MPEQPPATDPIDDESPPFLRTWRNIYIVVLVHLVFWVSLLYLFTRWFRPESI